MQLNNLDRNTFNSVLKKMNTLTIKQLKKTSKTYKKKTENEIRKRNKASKVIQKKYKAAKTRKLTKIMKNGMNIINEYIAGEYFPNTISNELTEEYLNQYKLSYREETLILKELIEYLLDITVNPRGPTNKAIKKRVNYVMNTSLRVGEGNKNEVLGTYKRFYGN